MTILCTLIGTKFLMLFNTSICAQHLACIFCSSGNAKRYNNFQCTGTEARLTDCSSDGPFPGGCTTASRAVVVCTDHEKDSHTCKLN